MTTRSTPDRLDAAVDSLLAGDRPMLDAELRPLVDVASRLAGALRPVPAGRAFELGLARRLAGEGDGVLRRTARELGRPGRLLAAAGLSSAAVGVTVTAYAVWRSSRRGHPVPQRLFGR
jgi:hypothetical protein